MSPDVRLLPIGHQLTVPAAASWFSHPVDAENRHADKWARRRAARRARPGPEESPPPIAPMSLYRSYCLWMVIGLPTVLVGVGIIILVAAHNLYAGYRGARIWLTVIGAPSFVSPIVILATAVATGSFAWPVLIILACNAVVISATVQMWRPEVTEHFRVLREGP